MSSPGGRRGRGRGHGAGGSGQIDEIPLDQWQTWDEFCKWFWNGSNGNNLIKKLNGSSQNKSNDSIRREKFRPTVYCIVLNDGQFPGQSVEKTETVQWKLWKVGFTHVDTTTGTNNRMEVVKNEVCRKYKDNKRKKAEEKQKKEEKEAGGKPKEEEEVEEEEVDAGVLFVLPIGAVDTTPFSETEERIRMAVGWPIHKHLAKIIGLPCSTEWVLTTQTFINEIINKIKEEKDKSEGTADQIDLFKALKFNKTGTKPPSWATLVNVKGVRTVIDIESIT